MASSLKGESSYSYLTDLDVGLSLIDRYTYSTLDFFEKVDIHSNLTVAELVKIYRWVGWWGMCWELVGATFVAF